MVFDFVIDFIIDLVLDCLIDLVSIIIIDFILSVWYIDDFITDCEYELQKFNGKKKKKKKKKKIVFVNIHNVINYGITCYRYHSDS